MSKPGFHRLKQNIEQMVAQGRVIAAIEKCEKYLTKYGDDIQAMSLLGMLFVREKHYDQAVEWFGRAHRLYPADIGTAYNLAKCLVEAGKFSEAEQYYRHVIKIDPKFIAAYFNLANTLRNLARFEEAVLVCRQAITIEPQHGKLFYALSLNKKFYSGDTDLKVMEKIRYETPLSESQLMYLLFALSKAYDDVGQYDESFECLLHANNIKRASYHYQANTYRQLFAKVRHVFDQNFIDRFSDCGSPSTRPVFILGMPRSGTTLTEQILSSHPQVHGAGEIDDLGLVISGALQVVSSAGYPDAAHSLTCQGILSAAVAYCARLEAYSADARYVVNKLPGNYLYIAMIKLLFPQAVVIHCRRDPLATCYSIYRQYFSRQHDYAYDLAELGEYYKLYSSLMEYWRGLLPDFIIDVDYESVITNQRRETARLLERLGLPWADECLHFQKNTRAVKTASASQVRKPIYTDSLSRWSHYKSHLAPLIDALKAS